VAWINVDGSIDIPGARGLKPSLQDGDFLKPDAIAETYWHLAHQTGALGRWSWKSVRSKKSSNRPGGGRGVSSGGLQ